MNGVSRIIVREDVTLVTFPRLPADALQIAAILADFASAQINIDMISHTVSSGGKVDLSFTLPDENLAQALEQVGNLRKRHVALKPMVSSTNAKIQLYGEEMRSLYGVASAALATIAQSGSELLLVTTSEVDISLLLPRAKLPEAAKALEKTFSVSAEWAE